MAYARADAIDSNMQEINPGYRYKLPDVGARIAIGDRIDSLRIRYRENAKSQRDDHKSLLHFFCLLWSILPTLANVSSTEVPG